MDNYLWYFHSEEEGSNFSVGRLLFKTPNERVKYIPITPSFLLFCANQGIWDIDYPNHTISKIRYDIVVNYIVLILVLIFIIRSCNT